MAEDTPQQAAAALEFARLDPLGVLTAGLSKADLPPEVLEAKRRRREQQQQHNQQQQQQLQKQQQQQHHPVAVPLPDLSGAAAAGGKRKAKRQRQRQQQQQADDAGGGAPHHHADDDGGVAVFGGAATAAAAAAAAASQQQQPEAAAAGPPLPEVHTNDPQEEANIIRRHLRIRVKGSDAPPPLKHWEDLARPRRPRGGGGEGDDGGGSDSDDGGGSDSDDGGDGGGRTKKKTRAQQQKQQQKQRPPLLPPPYAAASGAAIAPVNRRLLQHLQANGWSTPTPIQRQAVPALLAGRELLAVAPTGSGKTLAFVLPMMALLAQAKARADAAAGAAAAAELWPAAPKALLLSPTHELAAQTVRVLKTLLPGSGLRCCLLNRLSAGTSDFSRVDVLVANPLRLKLLVEEGKVDLSKVSYLVLDEADKLLALGFTEQVDALLAAASSPRVVRALFSATLPDAVEALARSVLRDPLSVVVGERNTAQRLVRQRLTFVGREAGKLLAVRQLLRGGGAKPPVLVFVATKQRAAQLHRQLMYDGVRVDSVSGDQPNGARAAAVENFRAGRTWVLIATDLVGRGIDFPHVHTVVNYDMPATLADYVHRVGRTGRAGQTGEAVTLFTEADAPKLRAIAHLVKASGSDVPDWMLRLPKPRKHRKDGGRRAREAAAALDEEEDGSGGSGSDGGDSGGGDSGGDDSADELEAAVAANGAANGHGGSARKQQKQQQQQQQQQAAVEGSARKRQKRDGAAAAAAAGGSPKKKVKQQKQLKPSPSPPPQQQQQQQQKKKKKRVPA